MTTGSRESEGQAPSVQSVPSQHNPHFAAVGAEGVAQLVERFYFHMDTRPNAAAIRALHPRDLSPVREVLTRYLTEWLGGPPLYSTERGHPRLRRRHLPFRIGEAERDAWMSCMRAALDEVVGDLKLRAELDAAFYKVADFLRNDTQHSHVQHAGSTRSE
jgi:hemoglobin